MQIDWWTLGLQTVNALVLIWLLAHFLFRPVVDAITARQKAAGNCSPTRKPRRRRRRASARRQQRKLHTLRASRRGLEGSRGRSGDRKSGSSRRRLRPRLTSFAPRPRPRSKPHAAQRSSPPKIGRVGLPSISPPSCSTDCRRSARRGLHRWDCDRTGESFRREPGHRSAPMATSDPSDGCPRGDPRGSRRLPQGTRRCPRTSGFGRGLGRSRR